MYDFSYRYDRMDQMGISEGPKKRVPKVCINDCLYGSVTVGERGQIVIPADAREQLGISPGDKLIVMRDPVHEGLILASLEAVQSFLADFSESVTRAAENSRDEDLI